MIDGPALAGLPSDDRGFIPIDQHARVMGVEDVYAAGDGTTFPIKQGGLATQQADAAAEHIAARLGAEVEPAAVPPGPARTADHRRRIAQPAPRPHRRARRGRGLADYLWWPPHKVSGRYLAAWLAHEMPRDDPEIPGSTLSTFRCHMSGTSSRCRSTRTGRSASNRSPLQSRRQGCH